MCRLRNIAMRDHQESVTTGQTDRRTDKVTPMCHYSLQATQKGDGMYEAGKRLHRWANVKMVGLCLMLS